MESKAHLLTFLLVLAGLSLGSPAHAQDEYALVCFLQPGPGKKECELRSPLPSGNFLVKLNGALKAQCTKEAPLGVHIAAGATDRELQKGAACDAPQTLADGVSARCDAKGAPKLRFTVTCGEDPVGSAKYDAPPDRGGTEEADQGAPPATSFPIAVWRQILEQELGRSISDAPFGHYYEDDAAILFYNSGAVPYFPLPEVDENDSIWIVVVDRKDVGAVEIALNGCNRPPLFPRVFRQTENETTSEGKLEEPRWQYTIRAFGKCAGADSGGPILTVKRGSTSETATVTVNPLYRFNVGVALGYDFTNERSFAVRTPAGDTVPRVAQSSDDLGLTSLIYVALHLAPRDFRKEAPFGDQTLARLQVFVGLDPRAVDEHLVVGAGYEVAVGLNVLAGWRVATKQAILAEGSGLEPGSPFDEDSSSLPTRKRWETGLPFFGVSLSTELLSRLK